MRKNLDDYLHPKQIPTKKSVISHELWSMANAAIDSLLKCLASPDNSFKQKNYLIAAASMLERISCLVYRSKDGEYRKLPIKSYYKEIFEGRAETPEEVDDIIARYGVHSKDAVKIHKLVWQIADLVCPMIACISEQAFVSEYAYAIEYVIQHDGNLPKPNITLLFPDNYPEYHFGEGIARELEKYEQY